MKTQMKEPQEQEKLTAGKAVAGCLITTVAITAIVYAVYAVCFL